MATTISCDILNCDNTGAVRCLSCDLDVCAVHRRSDGLCIYCSPIGRTWKKNIPGLV